MQAIKTGWGQGTRLVLASFQGPKRKSSHNVFWELEQTILQAIDNDGVEWYKTLHANKISNGLKRRLKFNVLLTVIYRFM